MDVFVSAILKWWQELTAFAVVAGVGSFLWSNRSEIQEWYMFFRGFRKRFEALEQKVLNPISPDARFCENCDDRMKIVDSKRFDYWFFKCETCNDTRSYPAPTHKLTR